jgi:hypothetical protein
MLKKHSPLSPIKSKAKRKSNLPSKGMRQWANSNLLSRTRKLSAADLSSHYISLLDIDC